ncbi:MAG TPA: lysine 2,3-aminomutase [Candidatus Anoxymicrobiaceae bacterium]
MKKRQRVDYKQIPMFSDVTPEQWNDWRWQAANVITDTETLGRVIDLGEDEKAEIDRCLERFRMAITPYYAALMDQSYPLCSIRLQSVPGARELADCEADLADPLFEDVDSPVPGLTHRYTDRVLFLVTNRCSMYCRHCTRRRMVGFEDQHLSASQISACMSYIAEHEEIRDVLLSGGDPLMLSDGRLESILAELRSIEHVEIIRIGTRMPVVLPMRITDELVEMLRKYQPIYVNTHFNHYKEITAEAARACERLADGGFPLGNQSVLLRDVNDCPRIMKKLVQELLAIRVKPYYLYQCDLSRGIGHFRTSVARGMEIIENLRGHTSGLAVPTFVVDAPGGGGKIPVMPNYLLSYSDKRIILRNYEGDITTYTQPENIYSDCWCELCREERFEPDGVARLLGGDEVFKEQDAGRRARRQAHGH